MGDTAVTARDFIQPASLASVASDWIATKILEGSIGPGQKVTEDGIATQMGISRSPVREALRALSREGLVTIEPRRGARVADLGSQHATDLYRCRLMLEPYCTRLAVEAMESERASQLDGLYTRMRETAKAKDATQYVAVLKEYNLTLLDGCPNRILFRLAETTWRGSLRYWNLLVRSSDSYLDQSFRRNRAVHTAVMKRDAAKAEEVAALVLEKGKAELEKILRNLQLLP